MAHLRFAYTAPMLVLLMIAAADSYFYYTASKRLELAARVTASYLDEDGEEEYLAEEVYTRAALGLTPYEIDNIHAHVRYLCRSGCAENDTPTGDADEDEANENATNKKRKITDDDDNEETDEEGSDYMNFSAEVTLTLNYRSILNDAGIPVTIGIRKVARRSGEE